MENNLGGNLGLSRINEYAIVKEYHFKIGKDFESTFICYNDKEG